MDINVQLLKDLKGEIDAVSADIKAKEEKWENATAEDKAFYTQSIQDLKDEKKALVASRDRLITNTSSSSQGKDISMAVSPPAKLCSRYMRTVVIRLVCSNVTASPSTCIGVLENDYDNNGGYIIT